ncbi:MAG: hypothetical protein ACD_17C00545G0007 [uncultured bacterium]|nr:MAG: hypothetical protein ACD_17C00545G0007 [uncultured bacterium]OGN55285.1 MAG: hypothetical protein A2796_02015 [Chlamydiae bacterium RIFCSPHIGHO2_01_FULL_44_39]OGN58278.1 MAG: hypothetical protein A3C42_05735 [Chlamydiae bacterium RIFCSPHIGHO2_02_FULL_45_9]OGN59800.1 MAG: hypothetical protein A3D96_06870 [Chlamydiae bacterium RIFCSPHIGHO2_12_FULL_44_59]OGN65898.1 MAG: hypothetical protein A2978_05825 [Chlamydiae bacterium RIFCSPLOWO2_01_FULL_44_52]OGN68308.1 MAG: hypothetical protein A3
MKMKEIIKEAKTKAPNAVILDLIEEFEEFASRIEAIHKERVSDKTKRQASIQVMSESYDRLRDKLVDAAAFYGMSFEELHRFIGHSMNFTPGDWNEVERVKKEIALSLGVPVDKTKKHHKNVRV